MIIKEIKARKINNYRNQPTIEVTVKTDKKETKASTPSGASKSRFEVNEFSKKGIKDSIKFLNDLKDIKKLKLNNFDDVKRAERILRKYDKTKSLTKVGGNTILALEYALLKQLGPVWKTIDKNSSKLPYPIGNCIGGGKHSKGPRPDFQEFLLLPLKVKSFNEAIKLNEQVYKEAAKQLKKKDKLFKYQRTDEGAWYTSLSNLEVIELLSNITRKTKKVFLGLDVAANSFYNKKYHYLNFSKEDKFRSLTKEQQINFIAYLIKTYNLVYVEDPLHENDFKGFEQLKKKVKKCFIVGDDLISTNKDRLKKAKKSINAAILKPNQVGSLIETEKFVKLADKNKINLIASHRSGETLDATISDLAVGFKTLMIKCGIYGKERIAKINRLKHISKEFN